MRDLALYVRLIEARVRAQMQYKVSFAMDLLASFVGTAMDFAAILILFTQVKTLGQWTMPEIALLYGLAGIALALADVITSGFDLFPELIRLGQFDQLLIRPRNVFWQVAASDFPLRRLGRVIQALLILIAALLWLRVAWGPAELLFLVLAILGGTLFFCGLFVIRATIAFWTIESLEAINILTYGGVETASYPMTIYADWMRRFFIYIVPLAFVSYYPALYLLNKPDPFALPGFVPFLAFPACAMVFLIAIIFWSFGVRHYQSTGH
jgi:ABC-2 type transport system permease protein